jgi:hypothetical protein
MSMAAGKRRGGQARKATPTPAQIQAQNEAAGIRAGLVAMKTAHEQRDPDDPRGPDRDPLLADALGEPPNSVTRTILEKPVKVSPPHEWDLSGTNPTGEVRNGRKVGSSVSRHDQMRDTSDMWENWDKARGRETRLDRIHAVLQDLPRWAWKDTDIDESLWP